ncbi:MAG: hypothetical protein CBB69_009985, partial [Phycisphaera sp. TMED9]
EETQCCVCIAPLAFAASLGCGHLLCWVCAHQLLTCGRTPQCPQCRQPANAADLRRNPGMDGIVEKLVAVRLSAEERAQWEERVEEGKKLEAEHRSAGAAAAGGGAAAAGARAAPYVQPPPPQPVVRRAQANLGIAVHLAPCGSPCEVCGGRGAAPNPRPGVVGEQLAAMLQITGLPAQSAAARPHTINQRLIGNRGRTFHLECADLKQLVKSTAERARPTAGAGAATTQVTVNIAADLAADAMGWQIGDHGFEMTLGAEVPEAIGAAIPSWVDATLADHGLTRTDVGGWAIHPGGPKVIDAVADCLDLPEGADHPSRAILREHGNMSSATLLHILRRLQIHDVPRPWVGLAFGPGLAGELLLLR